MRAKKASICKRMISEKLHEGFYELLITWPLRDAKGECKKDPWVNFRNLNTLEYKLDYAKLFKEMQENSIGKDLQKIGEQVSKKMDQQYGIQYVKDRQQKEERLPVELERDAEFGDGHYEERRKQMDITLQRLERRGRTDFGKALKALIEAKQAYYNQLLPSRTLDSRREFITKRNQLKTNLEACVRDFRYWLVSSPRPTGISLPLAPELETVVALETLLDRLSKDEFINWNPPGSLRRNRRGPPSRPWLQKIKRELKTSGVPQDYADYQKHERVQPQKELLICCGLLPFEK